MHYFMKYQHDENKENMQPISMMNFFFMYPAGKLLFGVSSINGLKRY